MTSARARIAIAAGVVLAGAVFWQLYSGVTMGVADFATVRARWQPSEAYLLDHDGVLLDSARIDYGVRRFDWIALDSISTALIDAVVDGEDRRFWTHHGVDWRAAIGAARDNLTAARRRGASTITMQLAAMLDSTNTRSRRSWLDKIEQVRAARAIESSWSKPQILEAYLNLLGFRG